ncbi:2,6-dihydropseudooxynicotine hydrolase [Brevundimonas vesicularis]|uniref:2,6-dihydropseudooxynicotine hydrolase n=1 Tax=Brevundimonas vesicularis TaxID=41276 RepID=A0A2X1BBS1_BREVE|nr:alpha/beta fold hydrolase [Brevundimonas vesicularis]SPU54803.1 2,6-dihydropseudooxynicotine hydrolase [Brevundimonas vesicularis]
MLTADLVATGGGYAPDGWRQWPDDAELSAQFVRILAAAQDGASTVGECFQAAGRIAAGDRESWHRAWLIPARRSFARAEAAEASGHRHSARANWIRAANYFRSAEFFLDPADRRRLPTFDRVESCSRRTLTLFDIPGEEVRVPYEASHLHAYWLPATRGLVSPAIVAFGGLDEYKDELIQEMQRTAHERGLSLLLVDLPGQGAALRWHKLLARPDSEVPVGACVDWLLARDDVDPARIALYGASLGGYHVTRAAAREHRVACAVSDGAQWKLAEAAEAMKAAPDGITATLCRWVFGAADMGALVEIARPFDLEPVVGDIRCPFLIVSGELDLPGADNARTLYAAALAAGVEVELRWFGPDETGAAHCQIDNPTIGMETICDWIADRLDHKRKSRG